MSKGQSIALIVIALVVVGLLIYLGSQAPTTSLEGDNNVVSNGTSTEPVGEEVAPGTSLINEDEQVVNQEGEPVDTTAEPGSPKAPQQSEPIAEQEAPSDSVKIKMSAGGIEPASFSVDSEDVVKLSVTSVDDQTHIFKFKDESLKGVAVGLAPGETRVIAFNAPSSGSYNYYCDVPGHEARGESGTMTVE